MCKSSCPQIRQWFLRYNTRSTCNKNKKDKIDFVKMKNIVHQKKLSKKWKAKSRRYNLLNYISVKRLISKELLQFNNKKTTSFKNWSSNWLDISPRKIYTNGQKACEKSFNIIIKYKLQRDPTLPLLAWLQ